MKPQIAVSVRLPCLEISLDKIKPPGNQASKGYMSHHLYSDGYTPLILRQIRFQSLRAFKHTGIHAWLVTPELKTALTITIASE